MESGQSYRYLSSTSQQVIQNMHENKAKKKKNCSISCCSLFWENVPVKWRETYVGEPFFISAGPSVDYVPKNMSTKNEKDVVWTDRTTLGESFFTSTSFQDSPVGLPSCSFDQHIETIESFTSDSIILEIFTPWQGRNRSVLLSNSFCMMPQVQKSIWSIMNQEIQDNWAVSDNYHRLICMCPVPLILCMALEGAKLL